MNKPLTTRTPTTLITGFLGAGKTTFINALLANKKGQKWAILVNEFGKIGIDGQLFDTKNNDELVIKEVSGGCICCTGQLPLQVALVRLLTDHHIDHLIIEPTGLAHPDELIDQLSDTHWQTSLDMRAVICVLNAAQWQQERYRNHDGYQAHVKFADIININRKNTLSADELAALHDWIHAINPNAIIAIDDASDRTSWLTVSKPKRPVSKVPLFTAQTTIYDTKHTLSQENNTEPPYRYHDKMAGFDVGGWRLPKTWRFDGIVLQKWLLNLPNYARIKGVIHSDEGWISLNITPQSVSIQDTDAKEDNRLELIFTDTPDWQQLDEALMHLAIY